MSDSQAKSIFIELVSRGGLSQATPEWLSKVTKMYDVFNEHHQSKVR